MKIKTAILGSFGIRVLSEVERSEELRRMLATQSALIFGELKVTADYD